MKHEDISGKQFGDWFVLERCLGTPIRYVCKCSCGEIKPVLSATLVHGTSTSCGCKGKDWCREHGMEKTPTYMSWAQMKGRCYNKNNRWYHRYGGRGIVVCERWHSFINFFEDMGVKPGGKSIERRDNNGNYEPGNCYWATRKEQIRNREVSPHFEWNGEMKSLAELSEMHGMKWRRVYERIRMGWPLKDALTIKRANAWNGPNARK
jgi:hypothetical protein